MEFEIDAIIIKSFTEESWGDFETLFVIKASQ
jgi:hypothetical protein